jgi:hypothetical protein
MNPFGSFIAGFVGRDLAVGALNKTGEILQGLTGGAGKRFVRRAIERRLAPGPAIRFFKKLPGFRRLHRAAMRNPLYAQISRAARAQRRAEGPIPIPAVLPPISSYPGFMGMIGKSAAEVRQWHEEQYVNQRRKELQGIFTKEEKAAVEMATKAIGVFAGGVVAAGIGLVKFVRAANRFTDELIQDRRKYEIYSGPIASAYRDLDLRTMMINMRLAARTAPGVSRLVEEEAKTREAWEPVQERIERIENVSGKIWEGAKQDMIGALKWTWNSGAVKAAFPILGPIETWFKWYERSAGMAPGAQMGNTPTQDFFQQLHDWANMTVNPAIANQKRRPLPKLKKKKLP